MAEIPFKLYPRGFLGAMLESRVEHEARTQEGSHGFVNQTASVMRNQNDFQHTNPAVETLYGQQINRAPGVLSFEFKRSVLRTALNAFGTPMFDFWFTMQFRSPAAGEMHLRFLDDTLRFIQTGRREMALETWAALLQPDEPKVNGAQLSEYAKEFFGIPSGGYNRHPRNRKITEVIQSWCSQPNGLEDLLCTMHVLFGKD